MLSTQQKRQEQCSMYQTPYNKSPVCTMPKTTYNKNDKGISNRLPFSAATTTERNVKIIAKPCSKRNMPFAPEFGDISRKIGEIKVPHQPKPK
jgi:hypothetical protein